MRRKEQIRKGRAHINFKRVVISKCSSPEGTFENSPAFQRRDQFGIA
jgi:hypothetical protein